MIHAEWDDHEGLPNLYVHAQLYDNLFTIVSFWRHFGRERNSGCAPQTYAQECSYFGGVFLLPPVSEGEAEAYPGWRTIDAATCR